MHFGALGPLEVRDDDGTILRPARGKQTTLLAILLAHAGTPVAVDDLIAALWGTHAPKVARSTLRVHLHRLRRLLGESRILLDSNGCRLHLPDDEYDVREFERLVAIEDDDAALALWRGSAFVGFEDVALIRRQAASLEELRVAAAQRRHDRQTYANAVEAPARDSATATDSTSELPLDLPSELPPSPATFVGREADLQWLGDALVDRSAGAGSVAAIYGRGGVGKSSLAIRAAEQISGDFPDGQLYVQLHGSTPGTTPLDRVEALGVLLRSLGLTDAEIPSTLKEASALLRSITASRKLLVVLDDAVDADQVRTLLPDGPGCATIVTSRSMLASLDGAHHHRLDTLSPIDAVGLVRSLAGDSRRDARGDDPDAVAEVLRLCDHLPLALCLAAVRLTPGGWTVATLLGRLRHHETRLEGPALQDRAARVAFALSYEELEPEAAQMLRTISMIDGSDLGLEPAAAAADMSGRDAERVLGQLVSAQLVRVTSAGRYALHNLIRLYARELALTEPEGATAAVRRAVEFYLATARNAANLSTPDSWRVDPGIVLDTPGVSLESEADITSWLKDDLDNITLAAQQATTLPGGAELTLGLAAAMYKALNSRGRWHEIQKLNEIALDAAASAEDEPRRLALAYNDVAWAKTLLGEQHSALSHLDQGVLLWERDADIRGLALSARIRSFALGQMNQLSEALDSAQEAMQLFRTIDDTSGQIDNLISVGLLHSQLGSLEDSIAAYRKGLDLAESEEFVWERALILGNLADVYRRAGRLGAAVDHFELALAADEKADLIDSYYEAEHRWGLGNALVELGDAAEARSQWDRAAAGLKELGLISRDEYGEIMRAEVPETPSIIQRQL